MLLHPSFRRAGRLGLLPLLILSLHTAQAGSATWSSTANINGSWGIATNWMPNTVPNGPADVATFATSTATDVFLTVNTEVASIVFNPGADHFSINTFPLKHLTVSGAGIINNSGVTQDFVLNSDDSATMLGITISNNATAGSNVTYTLLGGMGIVAGAGGHMTFNGTSTADHADFQLYPSDGQSETFSNSFLDFEGSSTAGNATITVHNMDIGGGLIAASFLGVGPGATLGNATVTNAGTVSIVGGSAGDSIINNDGLGSVQFQTSGTLGGMAGNATITSAPGRRFTTSFNVFLSGTSTADHGVFVNNGGTTAGQFGAKTTVTYMADAATGIFIGNSGTNGGGGGIISFGAASLGSTARIEVFGNGTFDISPHDAPGVTTGSIEGDGLVFLGARNLTLGSNNLSTAFSGVIQDGGSSGGTGGSLTKTGPAIFTMTGTSTYTGGTTVSAGTLVVNNTTGSGTGTGPVQVLGGTLAGNGTIAGPVTVGGDNLTPAFLAPGNRQQATLTMQSSLTFAISSSYECSYRGDGRRVQFDQVLANGVVINDGSGFNFQGTARGNLRIGSVLTVISNTSATPITGAFNNLADGAIFPADGGNFQASYEGGDGNDLTLTVVP
jgi:autotransporter-associated beta strand protein